MSISTPDGFAMKYLPAEVLRFFLPSSTSSVAEMVSSRTLIKNNWSCAPPPLAGTKLTQVPCQIWYFRRCMVVTVEEEV